MLATPSIKKLTPSEVESILERLQVLAINVNEDMVSKLVELAKKKNEDPTVWVALDLLRSYTCMLVTVGTDVEVLLEDRAYIVEELELYKEIKEQVSKLDV